VGIVVFVVADAVLITLALQHTREGADNAAGAFTPAAAPASTSMTPPVSMTPPPATASTVSPAMTTSTEPAATTKPTSSPTSSTATANASPPGADRTDPAAAVLLDMASDGSVIRASRGSCTAGGSAADRAVVEVSSDAGETWSPVESSSTAVERVAAGRSGKSWFVATDDHCALVEHDSAGGGESWTTSSPDGAWALPVDAAATSILAPIGDVEIGCTPVSLAPIGSKGAVVACADGALRISTDSGKTWTDGARVPGVVGISFVGPNSGYALAASAGCAAQVWQTTDGATSFSKLACLDGKTPQAITAAGSTILVQVNGAVQRSDDEGETWIQHP
jgi:hypothetical protein